MKKNPVPMTIKPMIILKRDVEVFPLSFLLAQYPATADPKKMMNIALMDWNQEAGTIQSPISRSVFSMV